MPNGTMKYHNYQPHLIKEVTIEHDHFPKLQQLGLNGMRYQSYQAWI